MSRSNDVILRTVAKFMILVIFVFSIYLFFTGHHAPGGGFIAGLMTSGALLLMAIAFGGESVSRVLPFDLRLLIGAGLSIAILTGIGAILFDVPFLSHTFGYVNLPLFGRTELSTAVLFDLGVYLTVVGVTMTILMSIGDDR